MIPKTAGDLDGLIAEAKRQGAEVDELLAALPAQARAWRPNEAKWSAIGHVAHLCIVNAAYVATMRERIERARREGGPSGGGPYRHPWIASWFVRSMEPPPKRRLKTMRSMVPDPSPDASDVLGRFHALQEELGSAMLDARGLDLGRIRFGSPFASLLRLSLGTGFEVVLAHNRRHIWLIREVLGWDGFPGGPTAAAG